MLGERETHLCNLESSTTKMRIGGTRLFGTFKPARLPRDPKGRLEGVSEGVLEGVSEGVLDGML